MSLTRLTLLLTVALTALVTPTAADPATHDLRTRPALAQGDVLLRTGEWSRQVSLTLTRPNAPAPSLRKRGYAWSVRQQVATVTSLGAPVRGRLTVVSGRDLFSKAKAAGSSPAIPWRLDKRGRLRLLPSKPDKTKTPGKKRPPPDPVLDRIMATLRALPPAARIDALLPLKPQRVGATWRPDASLVAHAAGLDLTALDPKLASTKARLKLVRDGRATIEIEAVFPIQLADSRSGEARVTLTDVRALSGEPYRHRELKVTLRLGGELPVGERTEATTLTIVETVRRTP